MKNILNSSFGEKWRKYFNGAALPIVFFYSDDERYAALLQPKPTRASGLYCLMGQLNAARRGEDLAFSKDTIGCFGGLRYAGYKTTYSPDFKYFLSCGIPGKMEGERYKKSPEIVERIIREMPPRKAEAKYIVFKRWDRVGEDESPQVVVFYGRPDVIAGLFTLANFRNAGDHGVVTPFSSGCGVVIGQPMTEAKKENPRAVLGLFDPSARPFIEGNTLTIAVPIKKFLEMAEDVDESFLITPTWDKVLHRIKKDSAGDS
jgi:uncharacterized protein (DUF169 family)